MQTKKFPILYKKDNKGKIREWEVVVKPGFMPGDYEIMVTHGAENGAKQTKITVIDSGKNIGKANETSVFEQACLEAESKWNKQKDKGYGETIVESFRPMLAQSYKEHSRKINFPCYVQPKLDGLRCIISLEDTGNLVARSRNGKEWKTIDHILEELIPLFSIKPDLILDGELFTTEANFQQIISGVKRDTPNEYTPLIQFWCYDGFVKNDHFKHRHLEIFTLLNLIPDRKNVITVDTHLVTNSAEIVKKHAEYVFKGYEGLMVRNAHGLYEPDKRSYNLQKFKSFTDGEFVITDKRLDKNGECVFTCVTDDGKPFDVKPEGDHSKRATYYYEDNIGSLLTVKYFELTNDGVPRFPVGLRVRVEE